MCLNAFGYNFPRIAPISQKNLFIKKSKIFKNLCVLKYAQIFILKSNVTHVFKSFNPFAVKKILEIKCLSRLLQYIPVL